MWRSILAIVLGVLAGGVTVAVVEVPAFFIHPPPADFDGSDPAQLAAHAAKAPPIALLLVAIAWSAGPFAGAFVAGAVARRAFWMHAAIIGVIFILLNVSNYNIPHPMWLMVAGIVLPPVMSWSGGLLAARVFSGRAGGPKPYDMREKNMAC